MPWQHEDLVLLCAVADEILTPAETDLIGDTRLDRVRIEAWARARNLRRDAVYKARARAEHRLRAYLNDQRIDANSDHGFAAAGAFPLYCSAATKPVAASDVEVGRRAVSGRLRNGSPVESASSVSKNRAESSLQKRGRIAAMADDRSMGVGPCR